MDTDFTVTQKRALAVATVLAVGFGAYFLRGQFMLVVVAGVVAYLFTPLFRRLSARLSTGSGRPSAAPTPYPSAEAHEQQLTNNLQRQPITASSQFSEPTPDA